MLLNVRNQEIETARMQLVHRAISINEQILQNLPPHEWMDEFAWRRPVDADFHEMILNSLGFVIAPLEFANPMFNFNDRAVIAAIAGESGFAMGIRSPDFNGIEHEWIVYAMSVERDGVSYIIYVRTNAAPMQENLVQLTTSIIISMLIALIITIVLWLIFANTISSPIRSLTRRARDMAAGNLDAKLPVQSNDEIGQLTESFNHMAKELNQMVSSLELEKNKHETVLHNMTDAVIAYAANGTLTHANNAATVLLQFDDEETLENKSLEKMLPLLGLGTEFPTEAVESSIAVNDRFIAVNCSPYTTRSGKIDGFVIVLQDITKHTRLDNMRREFVANVSHELRTPLATICGYVETLLDGALEDGEMAVNFLRTIDTEAKRMSSLVTDLLELSKLDSSNSDFEYEVVDLVGIVKMAVKNCSLLAEEKGQQIKLSEPTEPCFTEAALGRINQVLVNIISNSIKYSPPKTKIELSIEEDEQYYKIRIQDYGMGIAKNDLERIFERFYRVDKARSRAMGGTGLGLAIAKEIMDAHGGKITANSGLGTGTIMTLWFNKVRVYSMDM